MLIHIMGAKRFWIAFFSIDEGLDACCSPGQGWGGGLGFNIVKIKKKLKQIREVCYLLGGRGIAL